MLPEVDRWLHFDPADPEERRAKSAKNPAAALPAAYAPISGTFGTPTTGHGAHESPAPRSQKEARAHLAILLPVIQAGCRRGLARHLDRVSSEIVRRLLAEADPQAMSEEEYRQRCEEAGEATTLAALISAYRDRLCLLQAAGADVFTEAAALELALLEGSTTGPLGPDAKKEEQTRP